MDQKGISQIFLVLGIVVLASLIGGYYLLNQKQSNNQEVTPIPTINKTAEPTSNTSESGNWKEYVNEEFNFTLNYPRDLQVRENDFDTYKSIVFSSEYKEPFSEFFNFGMIVHSVQKNTHLRTWLDSYVIQGLPSGKKDSIVSGEIMPYQNGNIEGFSFIGGKESENKYVFFKNGNFVYEVILSGSGTGVSYKENPTAEEILDNILSTFKFSKLSGN